MAEAVLTPARSLWTPGRVLFALTLATVGAIALFMTLDAKGSWGFVLPFRGRKVWGMAIAGYAIAVSTVLFQTITHNRILTPAVMGFDWLYRMVQTVLVFTLGGLAFATINPQLRFVADVAVMSVLSMLLFRWLFNSNSRSLHLLVLVGIVFGVLFRSLQGLMLRLINPNDFAILQDANFASFSVIDPSLLLVSTIMMALVSVPLVLLVPKLDVLALGRETAISLGVDYQRTVSLVLVIVAVLVSISTALVGPVLFFGLLVANLAYMIIPSHKHAFTLPAAILLGIMTLVGGQAILEHALGFDTALSIIIEFAGGIVFLALLLKGVSR